MSLRWPWRRRCSSAASWAPPSMRRRASHPDGVSDHPQSSSHKLRSTSLGLVRVVPAPRSPCARDLRLTAGHQFCWRTRVLRGLDGRRSGIRGNAVSTTHGSAHWAAIKDLRKAGLLDPTGAARDIRPSQTASRATLEHEAGRAVAPPPTALSTSSSSRSSAGRTAWRTLKGASGNGGRPGRDKRSCRTPSSANTFHLTLPLTAPLLSSPPPPASRNS